MLKGTNLMATCGKPQLTIQAHCLVLKEHPLFCCTPVRDRFPGIKNRRTHSLSGRSVL